MHICFKIRHSKNPTLPSTIYARVSIAGAISDVSTLVKTYKHFWTGQKVKGCEDSKKLNMKLQKVKSNLFTIYDTMLATEPENITASAITDIYTNKKDLGVKKEKITFWKACNLYFEKKYTSKKAQPNTVRNNKTILRTIFIFLKENNYINILPNQLKPKHLEEMKEFLQDEKNLGIDTSARALSYCIRVIRFCILEEFITHSPITEYRVEKENNKDKTSLNEKELHLIETYVFESNPYNPNIERARDIFVFLCYTGFNISDYFIFAHNPENYFFIEDGKTWINMGRKKIQKKYRNKTMAKLPLFPTAKNILEKYTYKLPVFTSNTINKHLKTLGKLVGIYDKKKMRTKVARKTFSNIFWNKKVDARVIQKMMGHAKPSTTTGWYTETNIDFMKDELKIFL
ncbi:MAG: tyrosine-type recombinase/integrase [Raineya sp.]|jgi:site-specific recombinase XerD|nr:tyrosine-type recombinase/integrase [Raineya sp.]